VYALSILGHPNSRFERYQEEEEENDGGLQKTSEGGGRELLRLNEAAIAIIALKPTPMANRLPIVLESTSNCMFQATGSLSWQIATWFSRKSCFV
jgi:hypothetical protein